MVYGIYCMWLSSYPVVPVQVSEKFIFPKWMCSQKWNLHQRVMLSFTVCFILNFKMLFDLFLDFVLFYWSVYSCTLTNFYLSKFYNQVLISNKSSLHPQLLHLYSIFFTILVYIFFQISFIINFCLILGKKVQFLELFGLLCIYRLPQNLLLCDSVFLKTWYVFSFALVHFFVFQECLIVFLIIVLSKIFLFLAVLIQSFYFLISSDWFVNLWKL